MTYPQCAIEPHDALEKLRARHKVAIKDYVIASELHKDGNRHLHAFLRYESRVTWSPTLWDIDGHHGNYQQAKSWKSVIQYCTKDGNYIANIDVQSAKSKKAARNQQMLTEDPKQLVNDGSISLFQLPSLLKSKALYQLLEKPYESPNVRGIWVVGKSGHGKSHYVRSQYPSDQLFLKSQSKWWDGYTGQPHVLLDDFDLLGQCLSHYLKIWADRFGCTGEVKGGTISLHHRTFWITSQYDINDIWRDEEHAKVLAAIRRRFRVIRIVNRVVTSDIENELASDGEDN